MRKRVPCFVFIICILASGLGVQAATLFIDPAAQDSPSAGETLTVHVKVADVINLNGYQFNLVFDATALEYTGAQEGKFLKADGTGTFFLPVTDGARDGMITIANTRLGSDTGVDGEGELVSVDFQVLAVKDSALAFQNVKLGTPEIKIDDPDAGLIDTDVVNGIITVPIPIYTITATGDANGSISPAGAVSVTEGEAQAFAITPADGYYIVDVLVDGKSVGAVSEYTFSGVDAGHTIMATFAEEEKSVTPGARLVSSWGRIKSR